MAAMPEAQRNATRRALNSDMQKLLGDETYQKYRKVRVETAKVKGKLAGTSVTKSAPATAQAQHAPASPTAPTGAVEAPKKKKKKGATASAPAS